MKRVLLLGFGLAAVSMAATAGFAAGAPARQEHRTKSEPGYRLVFKIEKGSYGSTISGAGLPSISESDNFTATATYPGIEIPSRGEVSIKRSSKHEDFASDGNGPAWEKTSSSGFDCRGVLESDLTLPPLVTGSSTDQKLAIHVELAKQVLVENATGHTGTTKACDQTPYYPDGSIAFYPASSDHPKSEMPQMLTAKLDVSLRALRKMTPGGKPMKISVDSTDNGLKRPPADCAANGDETCTQQLGWKGFVEITRTG